MEKDGLMYVLHTVNSAAFTDSNDKCFAQSIIVVLFSVLYSSVSSSVIIRFASHTIIYFLLPRRNERKSSASGVWIY